MTSPDRYRSTPAHYTAVGLAVLATISVAVGMAAGPRAGLVAATLLIGLPCAATAVLVLLCLAVDVAATAVHRRARHRAGLGHVAPDVVEGQALAHLAHHLDQEA